jgi:hypothetical protein
LFLSAKFVKEAVFSPSYVLSSFVKDQLAADTWVYDCIFYSDPLAFLSVFVSVSWCFYCYSSIVWSQVLWYLQHCCFCSELPWLFKVFCVPCIFQDWFFYFCAEYHWNFDRDYVEHIDWHFHNFDSTIYEHWKVFSSSDILFDFSLQWFIVFIKKVFGFPSLSLFQGTCSSQSTIKRIKVQPYWEEIFAAHLLY